MPLTDPSDQLELESAVEALENSNWLIQVANLIGKPVELLLQGLPSKANDLVLKATTTALRTMLRTALSTMDRKDPAATTTASPWWHRIAVTVTGGVGGAIGLPALIVELPLSTTIMLRSIADVARAEGEDLDRTEARLACIEVFALGGHSSSDDASETGYFAVRAALSRSVSEAATYLFEKGLAEEAPVILRFIQQVAQRFAPAVADKAAAQAAPIVGALGGASVNLLFINHFQNIAQGHFTVRRLERTYGREKVREEYEKVKVSRDGG